MSAHGGPYVPAPGTPLCRLEEIPAQGRGFAFGSGKEAFRLFLLRAGAGVVGYVNRCPHFNIPLDSGRNRFLTPDRARIFCTVHCAEFRISDGLCVEGPCQGHALAPVALQLAGDEVRFGSVA
jgi:nitrite reductase/ring-hydroxylating ferredoxin subunit